MKRISKSIISIAMAASMTFIIKNTVSVSAATKEDVVAAARDAGFSEVYVQQGINYLEANPNYTSADYDSMIAALYNYANTADDAINGYLDKTNPPVTAPAETEPPAQETIPSESESEKHPVIPADTPQKDYASMTPEEKKEYVAGLTNQEKNQILKDLDKDKQLEIINGLIDASSALGMNVTVDELTGDTLKYSIKNDSGKVVDSSAVGIIIDDTGIDYSPLILGALAVIALSGSGLIILSLRQKKQNNKQN